jgi:hypothetical protein
MSKQFCLRGHDIEVVGRNAARLCRECAREDSRRWRAAHPGYDREYVRRWYTANPEYFAWKGARQRTTNPRAPQWKNYGARGITMAPEWLASFEAFLAHIGPRPGPEYSLDRIDNDGPYAPFNVRWSTRSQQERNKRPRVAICP